MVGCKKRKRREPTDLEADKSVAHEGAVKRNLLRQRYAAVLTLREYALVRLPRASRLRRKKISCLGKGDSVTELEREASTFLDSTLVCSCTAISPNDEAINDEATYEQWLSFSQKNDESHVTLAGGMSEALNTQSEIVDFVVWLLFKRERRPGYWPKNLLCDGFRKRSKEEDPAGTAIPDIYSLYPNHRVASLKENPWAQFLTLLGRSGQKTMLDLLTQRSIFVPVDVGLGNYYQLCGLPFFEFDDKCSALRPRQLGSITDIVLCRSRIFYGKPALTARGRIKHGYKHLHALNRFLRKHGTEKGRGDENLDAKTSKIMMYIFPRQFGLHNVFESNVNPSETAQKFQDYTYREEEIVKFLQISKNVSADGTPKIPKRLRGSAMSLVRRLQLLHSRCSYHELLKYHCSSKLDHHHQHRLGAAALGEHHARDKKLDPFKCICTDTGTHLPQCHDEMAVSLSRHEAFQFNSIIDLSTSQSQISSFCQAVLSKIVPNDFWGQGETMLHNKTSFLRQVDRFIRLRRYESMSLHDIFQGFKVAEIPWLQPPGLQNLKTSQSDIKKRNEIFHELLYYIFDSLLIPLIKTNFYVTEANTHRNRVFYFRHDIWKRITSPTISIWKKEMFEEITLVEAKSVVDSRSLGFSQMRLLPKGNKFRPIMNLRRRQAGKMNSKVLGPSINSVLSPIDTALKYEKSANSHRLGSALFAVNDIYSRLKAFKQNLGVGLKVKLYFAKVDVQAAFDTIPQDGVLQLIQSVLCQSKYTIIKHAEIQSRESTVAHPKGMARPIQRWKASVLRHDQDTAFTARLRHGLANWKRDTIFVDGVAQKNYETSDLMCLMSDHIRSNLVKIGKKYYRQKRGIPQGSVLSPFLCNYFYADLEMKHLDFLAGPDCLLMRLIDDFLLITVDREKAIRFVETMHRGLPKYGVRVSPHKTLTNFPMSLQGASLQRTNSNSFPYCGIVIDDVTLEVTKDLQGAKSTSVANSLTIDYGRLTGYNFQRRILNTFKTRSQLMFFDTAHNSTGTVLKSLRHAFHETACKMVTYVRCLSKTNRPRISLIIHTICKVAETACSILSSKFRRLRYPDYVCSIRRGQVMSTAHAVFLEVLTKHQTNYGAVIEWLRKHDKRLVMM